MKKRKIEKRLSDSFLWEFNRLHPITFSDPNLLFCKIGKKEHLEQLQNGIIYARPLGSFSSNNTSEMSHRQIDVLEGCAHSAEEVDIVFQGIVVGKGYGVKERIGKKLLFFVVCCPD